LNKVLGAQASHLCPFYNWSKHYWQSMNWNKIYSWQKIRKPCYVILYFLLAVSFYFYNRSSNEALPDEFTIGEWIYFVFYIVFAFLLYLMSILVPVIIFKMIIEKLYQFISSGARDVSKHSSLPYKEVHMLDSMLIVAMVLELFLVFSTHKFSLIFSVLISPIYDNWSDGLKF
jgi:hypothetical protein